MSFPITKDQLLKSGLRFRGQVGKQWIGRIIHGKQVITSYGKNGDIDPTPWLSPWQAKLRAGNLAAQALTQEQRQYWQKLGTRKKRPLTWYQTFMSAWLLDLVNLSTMRHVRNLATK